MFTGDRNCVVIDGSGVVSPPFNESIFESMCDILFEVTEKIASDPDLRLPKADMMLTCASSIDKTIAEESHNNPLERYKEQVSCLTEYTDSFYFCVMSDWKKKIVKIYKNKFELDQAAVDLALETIRSTFGGDEIDFDDELDFDED